MDNRIKHICDLEYCKKHSSCIFKNAEESLRTDPYIVALGDKECSDRILCYQKEDIGLRSYVKPENTSSITINKRQCVKCYSTENLKDHYFTKNPKILLCESCDSKIHQHKTNHELAVHFNTQTKIISLLNIIDEIEKQGHTETLIKQLQNNNVIRCSNIYCGTENDITKHHLIPKPYRRGLCAPTDKIPLCRTCHDKVHRLKTNKQLAKHYNTKEAIIELLAQDIPFRIERVMHVNEQYQYASMVA